MAEYAGSATVIQWITSAGTLAMSGDSRSLIITPSQDTIDSTAGSDTSKQFIPSFTTWDVSWEGVAQDGTAGTAYTAPGWKVGDATSWDANMRARTQAGQNEYPRTSGH